MKRSMKLPVHKRRANVHSRDPQSLQRTDAGRIGTLKRKLELIEERILAAIHGGDFIAKGQLDTEAANLQAIILRAESLVARDHR
jgi:hypothetical protein